VRLSFFLRPFPLFLRGGGATKDGWHTRSACIFLFEFLAGNCATCCNQSPDQNFILSFLSFFFSFFQNLFFEVYSSSAHVGLLASCRVFCLRVVGLLMVGIFCSSGISFFSISPLLLLCRVCFPKTIWSFFFFFFAEFLFQRVVL